MGMDDAGGRREAERRDNQATGAVLLGVGAAFLLTRLFDAEELLPAVLGAAFLLAGVLRREAGWLIPGGVLSGIALGAYLSDGPSALARGDGEGGLFLLGFSAGWFATWALSALRTPDTLWWALIPAGVMAAIGLAVLGGGVWLSLLGVVGSLWPVGLVAGGAYLLYRGRRG